MFFQVMEVMGIHKKTSYNSENNRKKAIVVSCGICWFDIHMVWADNSWFMVGAVLSTGLYTTWSDHRILNSLIQQSLYKAGS